MLMPPVDSDKRKAVVESGKGLPEGEPKEEIFIIWNVRRPRCGAEPGFPCTMGKKSSVTNLMQTCNARFLLWQAYALGTVDVNGMGKSGQVYRPTPGDISKEKNN
jgi:hypothetical protein